MSHALQSSPSGGRWQRALCPRDAGTILHVLPPCIAPELPLGGAGVAALSLVYP
jgi:hypothetical protein